MQANQAFLLFHLSTCAELRRAALARRCASGVGDLWVGVWGAFGLARDNLYNCYPPRSQLAKSCCK
jgi:hypothetical protein